MGFRVGPGGGVGTGTGMLNPAVVLRLVPLQGMWQHG